MGFKKLFAVPLFLVAFQNIDASNLGPLAGLVGSLGSASAAVVVVIVFLSYVKDQAKTITELKDATMQMQKDYHNSLEDITKKFIDRQEDLQDFFEKQLTQVTRSQNEILHETILTVKSLERSLENMKQEISLVLIKTTSTKLGLSLKSDQDIEITKSIEDKNAEYR